MDPVSYGVAAISFISAINQADEMRKEAEYSKRLARINQQRLEMMAEDAVKRGGKEAVEYGKKVKSVTGAQVAALAAQGIDVSFGSAASVIEETQITGTEEINKIRNNAFREALGYKLRGQEEMRQAEMNQYAAGHRANATVLAGGLSAVNSLNKNKAFGG